MSSAQGRQRETGPQQPVFTVKARMNGRSVEHAAPTAFLAHRECRRLIEQGWILVSVRPELGAAGDLQ